MPDLGKYTFEVLASYGITIALIAIMSALVVLRARRVKQALDVVEARVKGQTDGD